MVRNVGKEQGIFFLSPCSLEKAAKMDALLFHKAEGPDCSIVIEELGYRNILPVLMTEENARTAASIATACKIRNVKSALTAEMKREVVVNQKQWSQCVGVLEEDLSVLKEADVSLTRVHANIKNVPVDILLDPPSLKKALQAIDWAKIAVDKMRQNVKFALIYPLIALFLAALGLLSPLVISGTMAMGIISVVTNAFVLGHVFKFRKIDE
jgi:cation transport ATPase